MKRRDLELLSSYLDGQLKPSDAARLESRLASDPDLRTLLEELRETRGLLRGLPPRKAPRNFTLTRQMVEKNPPMPRVYPAFRFATGLATLLLFLTFGVNLMAAQMASRTLYGMGGGGAPESFSAQAPAVEAPLTEAPAEEPPPPAEMVPMPTEVSPAEDSARSVETPAAKNGLENQPDTRQGIPAPIVPILWQIVLAGVVIIGALLMLLLRRAAISRWRTK